MSLQGSLETFALPDVLVLLASTKKDGELRVVGGKVDGKVWVEKGQIVHSDVNGKEAPPVDAVFELLRLDSGTFSFDADSPSPKRREPAMVDLVLADAQVRLSEWKDIAKVVPHLDVLVDMAEAAPSDEVTISRGEWKLLRHVAGGCSVHALMGKLDKGEFETCKLVKELADSKLVSIDTSAKPKHAAEDAPAPAAADAPNGVQKRPADVPRLEVKAAPPASPERSPADKAPADRDADRVEDVKAEVEKELAALVDEAAKTAGRPSADDAPARSSSDTEPPKARVRATTAGPGAPEPPMVAPVGPAAANKPAAGEKPGTAEKPIEETKALVAQLAALEGENEEKIAKKVEEHLARGGELPEVGEGDEPINRGLLLKFLSSVRN